MERPTRGEGGVEEGDDLFKVVGGGDGERTWRFSRLQIFWGDERERVECVWVCVF